MNSRRMALTGQTRAFRLGAATLGLAALIGAGGGLWYLFLRPAGPAPVGASTAPVPATAPTSAGATSSATGSTSEGFEGTWVVDTSIGSFDDFTSSFVGYRVQEELASIGGNIAVGRTPQVSGSLTVEGTSVTAATIEADLTALKSDDDRRDGQLARQGIETGTYPTATFTLTSPIVAEAEPADGDEATVTASGQLTLHGVTRDVQIPLTVKLSGDVVVVTGSLEIAFADYGIEKPTSFAVLSVADHGTLELQLFFTKA
jgi:polyisoprenoid-binding protein YceI